ncbi:hypothetical protein ACLOJK_010331 [Asimina triloba]
MKFFIYAILVLPVVLIFRKPSGLCLLLLRHFRREICVGQGAIPCNSAQKGCVTAYFPARVFLSFWVRGTGKHFCKEELLLFVGFSSHPNPKCIPQDRHRSYNLETSCGILRVDEKRGLLSIEK